ncbi:BadF/BadG/BcrA/BcrD ATPase family protein [Micromonospora sp. NPDC048830]|uniref:BadF/BadG/BcrA/BcrD ATPase family protein n=1 Tax=Micromonospora sp. NPDC048830 TaxID=3364257 RepID=UPI00371A0018
MQLSFDVGQTRSRARVSDSEKVLWEGETEGFSAGGSPEGHIARVVEYAASRSPVDAFDTAAGGSTGLHGRIPPLEKLGARLHATAGVRHLYLADDAVTSHLGAFAGEPGVLAAVGTGLVALGAGSRGVARVDGVGPLIGDKGAGFWIGREGIIAALSARDGRTGGSSALLDRLREQFGDVDDVPGKVAGAAAPIAVVASFAVEVAAAARAGDEIARGVWRAAAAHIANAVCAAADGANLGPELTWSLTGRIAEAGDLLEPALSTAVAQRFPQACRVAPQGTALDGARHLPGAGKALHESALVAEYHHG